MSSAVKSPWLWAMLVSVAWTAEASAQGSRTFVVNTIADTVDANPNDGQARDATGNTSLRAAIQEGNRVRGNVTIVLPRNTTLRLTIPGAGENLGATGDLDVLFQLTLDGANSTIDAAGLDRIFDVTSFASLKAQDVTLMNGAVINENGGAIRSQGPIVTTNCVIKNSTATGPLASGGGIALDFVTTLTMDRCVISGNSASRAGGGVEGRRGNSTFIDCDFTLNQTGPNPGNGGAFHITVEGEVLFRDCRVYGNFASSEGGGIWNSAQGNMRVVNSEVFLNVAGGADATNGGGGVFNDRGLLEIRNSVITGNLANGAAGSGGGVFNDQGAMSVLNSTVSNNYAERAGGGIESNVGQTELSGLVLSDNETGAAPGNGGAFHLTGAGTVDVTFCEIIGNKAAQEGGGLWNSPTGLMTITDCIIESNSARGALAINGGGGVFNNGGEMTVDGCEFSENVATGAAGSGGGIMNNNGMLSMTNTLLLKNGAMRAGGGVEANIGETTLLNVELSKNFCGLNPGNGGGLHLTGAGTVDIARSQVTRNAAGNEGGGLWNSATGVMTVTATVIRRNDSPNGSDNFNDGGTFTVDGDPVPAGP